MPMVMPALLLLAVVLLAGCGGDGDVALDPLSPGAAATTVPGQLPQRATDLADGSYAVFLTGIDVSARTLTVDVVRPLSDDVADQAIWVSAWSRSPEPAPRGHVTVSAGPRRQTLSVEGGVPVSVVWKDAFSVPNELSPRSIPFEELPAYLGGREPGGLLSSDPFWLRLVDGVVVGIEEQYVP